MRTAGAVLVLIALVAGPALAADYTSVQNGNWNDPTTWGEVTLFPNSSYDNATINHQVTLNGSYSVGDITIGSGGTFVCNTNYYLFIYGDWENNGTANWLNGYADFRGSSDVSLGGSNPTTFFRVYINKIALANTVLLNQNMTVSYTGATALDINIGTLSTNGNDLTVNSGGASVSGNGSNNGRLEIGSGSEVSVHNLDQGSSASGLGSVTIDGSATVVNISGTHQVGAYYTGSSWIFHVCNIYAGTIEYLGTGSSYNLDLNAPTYSSSYGWYATGGLITFNGSVRTTYPWMSATGSAVVVFAGSENSTWLLLAYGGGPITWRYSFNDIRIQKGSGYGLTMTANPGGMVRSDFLCTNLTVNTGNTLSLNYSGYRNNTGWKPINVVNNGTINHTNNGSSSGSDGNIIGVASWAGTGDFVQGSALPLPNFTATGSVAASSMTTTGTIAIGGNLDCSGAYSGTGSVVFNGTGSNTLGASPLTTRDLTVDKTGSVTLTDDLTVESSLTIDEGTFATGENTLTLGTTGDAGSVSVEDGGTFEAVGAAFAQGAVEAASESYPYEFEVNPGGSIGAQHADFKWMDDYGITVYDGALIDATDNFSNCTFDHGGISGPMLVIENAQTLDDMWNVGFSGTDGYNIDYTSGTGHVTVTGGPGDRWGEAYDDDPGDDVDWLAVDAGVSAINAPVGTVVEFTEVTPEVQVSNYGDVGVTVDVRFVIDDGTDAPVYDTTETGVFVAQGNTVTHQFTKTWTAALGSFTTQAHTILPGDQVPSNDTADGSFEVVFVDAGVSAINAPVGEIDQYTDVTPEVVVNNYCTQDVTVDVRFIVDDGSDVPVYDTTETSVFVAAGGNVTHAFIKVWPALSLGSFTSTAYTILANDHDASNDTATAGCTVGSPWSTGWSEAASMPTQPSGRVVKRGGWLATLGDVIYAGKGYKTQDFYRYNPMEDSWYTLGGLPYGEKSGRQREAKKGSRGVGDGGTHLYYTAGNNTNSFFKYYPANDSWTALPDVPEGPTRKNVKGGNDMAYVVRDDTGYVYLMKGYKTEFYRFNVETEAWEMLADVPASRGKIKRGSWLAYDGMSHLYAHEANYYNRTPPEAHYMYRYDLLGDSWSTVAGMPLYGLHGGRVRKKKSKDGGSGDHYDGALYALKGGNTQQFWKYDIAADTWGELDTVPTNGSTGRKRRVKYGAKLVHWGGGTFFTLKGNKTAEMWRYVIPATVFGNSPGRSGVLARRGRVQHGLTVSPNPLAGGFATLRYALPKAGAATLSVFDVTGRQMTSRSLVATRTGAISLDLRSLSNGVYLVRLDADDYTTSRKLVVQH